MGWHTRFTRFGDMHMVFSQEGPEACGIACVRMVAFKINKMDPFHRATFTEEEMYKNFTKKTGRAYDGETPTDDDELVTLLNSLNCGIWESVEVGVAGLVDALIDSVGKDYVGLGPAINAMTRGSPAIICVDWNKGGGHWVVVDTINSVAGHMWASVCDPWDGDVHVVPIKKGAPLIYKVNNQAFTNTSMKTDGKSTGGAGGVLKTAVKNLGMGKTSWSVGGPKFAYRNSKLSKGKSDFIIRRKS